MPPKTKFVKTADHNDHVSTPIKNSTNCMRIVIHEEVGPSKSSSTASSKYAGSSQGVPLVSTHKKEESKTSKLLRSQSYFA